MDIQLWAFEPGGTTPTILPQPLKVDAGMVLSDVSSLSLTYPVDAPGVEMLAGYCDIEVRYRVGDAWVCPPQGRFALMDSNVDPAGEATQPTRTYTAVSWGWLLSGVLQAETTGLDDSGNRVFLNYSPAEVVGILIGEAQAGGFTEDLTFDNQAGTGGWSPTYQPGKSVADILSEGRDQGFFEWLIQPDDTGCGRKLTLYGDIGVDRSPGDVPVALRIGRDFPQTPSKVSARDLASKVLVAGDTLKFLTLTNPGADVPYGMLQTYVGAAGLNDAGALEVVGQARLDSGKTRKAEHTRPVVLDGAQFLPLIDYGLGDTILGPDENGQLAALRVRQITMSFDGRWTANLVLGDRFSERNLILDRRVRQMTSGMMLGGGRPVTAPAPPIMDNTDPPVASQLTASSRLGMVQLHWNGQDNSGQPVGKGFDHAEAERDTTSAMTNPVAVGTFNSAGDLNDGPLTVGSTYYYRLVIMNAAGTRSSGGAVQSVTVNGVTGPDITANSVAANKLDVGYLSAIASDLGTVNAGTVNGINVNGSIITGGLFQTATSGQRLIISPTAVGTVAGIAFTDGSSRSASVALSSGSINMSTFPNSTWTATPSVFALSPSALSLDIGTSSSRIFSFDGSNGAIAADGNLSLTATEGSIRLITGGNQVVSISNQLSVPSITGPLTVNSNLTTTGSLTVGGNLNVGVLSSGSGSANVFWNSSTQRFYTASSLNKLKMFKRKIRCDYSILELMPKTWIDRTLRDEIPGYDLRTAGFVAEEVEAVSRAHDDALEPLLMRSATTRELEGLAYDRISAYLIPVVADMDKRLRKAGL